MDSYSWLRDQQIRIYTDKNAIVTFMHIYLVDLALTEHQSIGNALCFYEIFRIIIF